MDTISNDGFVAPGRSICLTTTILVHGDATVVQSPKAGNIGECAQVVHYGWGTAIAYHLRQPPQQYPLKHQHSDCSVDTAHPLQTEPRWGLQAV
jgi:hypothetical protein